MYVVITYSLIMIYTSSLPSHEYDGLICSILEYNWLNEAAQAVVITETNNGVVCITYQLQLPATLPNEVYILYGHKSASFV